MKRRRPSRRRLRRAMRPRIGRARTRIVKCVFEAEAQSAYRIIPGAAVLSSGTTYFVKVPGWQTNSGGPQAVTYAFTFGLNSLASFPIGNYRLVSQLYDYVKLYKVQVVLRSPINPQVAVQATNTPGQYDFTNWPLQDPVLTYPDYDGWNPMPNIGSSGAVLCPSNGDMTQLLFNKPGVRKHRPFGTIKRTFYPKMLLNACGDNGGQPYPAGSVPVQGGRAGWMVDRASAFFTGQLIVSIPYLGQDASVVNLQPLFYYAICNKWFVGFKTPLYG